MFAKFTVAALGAAGQVGQRMQQRCVIALGRRAGCRAHEARARGHLDEIIREAVVGAVAAMADIKSLETQSKSVAEVV